MELSRRKVLGMAIAVAVPGVGLIRNAEPPIETYEVGFDGDVSRFVIRVFRHGLITVHKGNEKLKRTKTLKAGWQDFRGKKSYIRLRTRTRELQIDFMSSGKAILWD